MSRQEGHQRAADYVKARRGALHLTQDALATAAGVDAKTVWNLEAGERWPQATTRAKIEAALGWSEGDLQRIRSGGVPSTGTEPAAETSRARELTPAERTRDQWVERLREDPELMDEFLDVMARLSSIQERIGQDHEREDPGESGRSTVG
jgi:transcriptional regulator with XRE-family HTH domain